MVFSEILSSQTHDQADQLELSRDRAVSTIMNSVTDTFPEIPYFVGTLPTPNTQCDIWRHYAQETASLGRNTTMVELGGDDRLAHPSSNVPEKLGSLALGLINSERDLRADAYEAVLPDSVVSLTELSDLDKKRIHSHVVGDWNLLLPEYRYSTNVMGQLTAKVLFTHILSRLPLEKELLVSGLHNDADSQDIAAEAR
ncbi:hypothetical protein H0X10_00530 [Candidatus Saccharibacteria bacterium]|nr:hypothetical protein [Candidatus Saccharibacteria bacterium]